MTTYTHERKIAIEAVIEAAALCRMVQQEMVGDKALRKDDRSPVTVADFGSQAVVCRHLKTAFPADPIVAEEDSAKLQQPENEDRLERVVHYAGRFMADAATETVCRWIDAGNGRVAARYWTLDPIDGTKGFLRGDQYAVALALVEEGRVQVAAMACPVLPLNPAGPDGERGVLFVAVRGEGVMAAPLNRRVFEPVRVAAETDESRIRFVESVESAHTNQELNEAVAAAAGISRPPLRMDSQAKYGAIARGEAALYLRLPSTGRPGYRERIWDHAAGSLIVEEAGGQVTDMYGKPLDFTTDYKMHHNRGVVVGIPGLHARAIAAITERGGPAHRY